MPCYMYTSIYPRVFNPNNRIRIYYYFILQKLVLAYIHARFILLLPCLRNQKDPGKTRAIPLRRAAIAR
jgi:hypothetical protein